MREDLLTVEEVAKIFKMAPGTIYNQLSRNAKQKFPIKPVRVGKLVRFNAEDLHSYINQETKF